MPKTTKTGPRFVLRRPEHFDECMICDVTDKKSLRGAVAVEFRPDDPPHLAAIYCKSCVDQLARVAR